MSLARSPTLRLAGLGRGSHNRWVSPLIETRLTGLAAVFGLIAAGCGGAIPVEGRRHSEIHRTDPAAITVTQLLRSQPAWHCDGEASSVAERQVAEREENWIMFVVDVSQSTAIAAGSDVDGDGLTGINPYLDRMQQGKYHRDVLSTDPGDTILAAEIGALCGLVREGIPVGHRFGLAVFSGWVHGPAFADAEVIIPLTNRPESFRRGLDRVAQIGSRGGTNYEAAIDIAAGELMRPDSARVNKRIILLSDGVPTLPIEPSTVADPGDMEAARAAAERIAAEKTKVHLLPWHLSIHSFDVWGFQGAARGRVLFWDSSPSLLDHLEALLSELDSL